MGEKNNGNEAFSERKWTLVYIIVALHTLAVYIILWLFPRLFS
jgi:hypothetical protein